MGNKYSVHWESEWIFHYKQRHKDKIDREALRRRKNKRNIKVEISLSPKEIEQHQNGNYKITAPLLIINKW